MDIFVDKNGKKVLTIKDDGDVIKDEKYFEDKKNKTAKELTDKELQDEYSRRDFAKEKIKELLDEATES